MGTCVGGCMLVCVCACFGWEGLGCCLYGCVGAWVGGYLRRWGHACLGGLVSVCACMALFSIPCPSESTLVQTCLYLPPLPPSCLQHTHNFCAHVKDPIFICRKRVGLTAGGMQDTKTRTTGKQKEKSWVARAVIWLLTFLRKSSLNFPPCIALGRDSHLIKWVGSCLDNNK